MKMAKELLAFSALTAAAAMAPTMASAAVIATGTVGSVVISTPNVSLTSSPANYTANFASTFQVFGTGAFNAVTGLTGYQNGAISFSQTAGTTINQTLSDFFIFNDGRGGTYNFSASSVLTRSFASTPGVTSSIALFILGTTSNANLGNEATPTSLTLTFNSSGGSPYSASSTLSIPAVTAAVPESATWAMMLVGFGMIGATARYRRRNTKIAYA